MDLNTNQLRSFLLVAEEGNLTRAAQRRHSTPSAVSGHLQQLEDRLGTVLFERTHHGMALTVAGERLLPGARRVIGAVRDLTDMAAEINGNPSRTVRVGLNAPPEHLQIGPLMAACARGEPPLVVQLESSMSERIIEDVAAERLDAGFVYGPVEDRALTRDYLATCRLRVAAPGGFELDRLPDALSERAALPWIWPGVSGCPFRRVMSVIL
ncbi:MAG: LysR family transcriptional regulator, partial [Halofilum sp. (in: g-proteobacteria)]